MSNSTRLGPFGTAVCSRTAISLSHSTALTAFAAAGLASRTSVSKSADRWISARSIVARNSARAVDPASACLARLASASISFTQVAYCT
ncbi:hypothetical protein ABTZ03_04675 [Kitasatospora sp. NPDC096077]|uniref:hypothetical protein n=1 Tax=Kitasatospora sp. NPDC096077 TaxID=3155544 RepID=UPI0033332580